MQRMINGALVDMSAEEISAFEAERAAFLTPPDLSLSDYENAIQSVVDAAALSKLFRDGVTLASYVTSTIELWAAQAAAFVAWRDSVWQYSYSELSKVQAGEREQPTIAEFLAELPPMIWPA